MCPLQNPNRSISIGEAFCQGGNFGINDKDAAKIKQANTADLLTIFRYYGLHIDEYNKKIVCPFPSHPNERTASFNYYKHNNSFYCFGCKNGGSPVNFVSLMDNVTRLEAANKILSIFQVDTSDFIQISEQDFAERQHIILGFSDLIRSFMSSNVDDKDAIKCAEKLCFIYDTINYRHKLDNGGLKSLIDKLKIKLEQFNK